MDFSELPTVVWSQGKVGTERIMDYMNSFELIPLVYGISIGALLVGGIVSVTYLVYLGIQKFVSWVVGNK
jgi:hypothetical protein